MIEVLEKGKPEVDRVYEAVCKNCRSRLRFKRSDARYMSDLRDGDDALVINCPVCEKEMWTSVACFEREAR